MRDACHVRCAVILRVVWKVARDGRVGRGPVMAEVAVMRVAAWEKPGDGQGGCDAGCCMGGAQ